MHSCIHAAFSISPFLLFQPFFFLSFFWQERERKKKKKKSICREVPWLKLWCVPYGVGFSITGGVGKSCLTGKYIILSYPRGDGERAFVSSSRAHSCFFSSSIRPECVDRIVRPHHRRFLPQSGRGRCTSAFQSMRRETDGVRERGREKQLVADVCVGEIMCTGDVRRSGQGETEGTREMLTAPFHR